MPFGPINEIKFLDILAPSHNLLLLFASGFPARSRDQLLESQAVTFDKTWDGSTLSASHERNIIGRPKLNS